MELYDKYFHENIELNPSVNDYLNLSKYKYLKNKMENPFSKVHKKKVTQLNKKYLALLNKKKILNIFEKTLKYTIEIELENDKYDLDLMPINHQENIITYILENANGSTGYIYKTKKDYNDFLQKIQIFPEIIDSIIQNMTLGIKKKITLPKIIAIKLKNQLVSAVKNKSYHVEKINVKLDFDYNKQLDKIFIVNLKKLINFLENTYIKHARKNIGLCDVPNGKKMYEYLVRSSLTLKNITIDKIHNYGIYEVERIYKEMHSIKDKLQFKGTLKQFNKYLLNKKSLKFKNEKEVLNEYKKVLNNINENIIPKYFDIKIKNKCVIKRVPKYNESYSAEAYYLPGDLENKRQGKFFINLGNIKDLSKIEMESLTLHEANPGHHFQITYHNESNIPLFIKTYNNDAYQEGWALYCENLGDYTSLESYYGKLVLEMLRALRIVVDTGIHYYKWDYNKTFKYYKKYSFDTDSRIHNQLLRYISIPSQALTYKMGEKFILELLFKYKGNIKDFHSKFMKYGPIPLFLLKETFK